MTQPLDPDPITILLAEHRAAEAVFARFEHALFAATPPAPQHQALEATRTLLAHLDGALELHIRREEGPLFPRLKTRLPADDRYVDELVAEHDQGRIRRDELRAVLEELLAGADHDALRQEREAVRNPVAAADHGGVEGIELSALRATGRVLLRTLRVHFQNEEELAFPLARQLLSRDELLTAGREMLAIEKEVGAMAEHEPSRNRPPGETTGSPQRPAQRVAGAVLQFDLMDELRQLQQEPAWQRGDRNAKTLVKHPDFRVVLTTLKAGAQVAQHQAPGRLTIHAVQGRLRVALEGDQVELSARQLLALDQDLPHAVTALEDSAFLLTIAWPADGAAEE